MNSKDLRSKYLKFFESKGHLVHASDSLVPDDPTLLYTSAGMVQFKPYYVGERVPPCPRITTSQKCLRTDDVDEVGDAVHHTFFEMLGNFSFGDYFKRDAIKWAWEFLTEVLELDPQNIWTSVYLDDDEAADVWINEVGFPADRLVRLGEDKNYWPANCPSKGPNGVCGPCNEIFLDTTPELGRPENPEWSIAHDGNRFVEIWNLVFTQYDRQDEGKLVPLPTKNIDTGMGLERTISILNGFKTNYETDLFLPIIQRIEELSGKKYGPDEKINRPIRVVADHIRAAVFTIADGVMPSNVGRGYVLRRVLRNAVLKGRNLGMIDPFLSDAVSVVCDIMGDIYPEIVERKAYIEKVVASEEDKFRRTLDSGLDRLNNMVENALQAGSKKIDGESAFTLYDTYGFPLELSCEVAAESDVTVDIDGFKAAMELQRQRAKEAGNFGSVMTAAGGSLVFELESSLESTTFVGYDELATEGTVLAIIQGDELVLSANAGDKVDVILDRTALYAESGGQVGDTGVLKSNGLLATVNDTVKLSGFFLHRVILEQGTLAVGDKVTAEVDVNRRLDIARNHSATHLLHSALHEVIGEHALQAGSVVDPERLRFDFSHFQAVTAEELRQIEDRVNEMILADYSANTLVTSIDEARKMGATALFGEKYGDTVRVVSMGEHSTEFCGGTHLTHTSQIGLFKLVSESSVGAGLRRIEGVTGRASVQFVHQLEDKIRDAAAALGSSIVELVGSAERASQAVKDAAKELEKIRSREAVDKAADLAGSAKEANGIKFITYEAEGVDPATLQKLADNIADKLHSGVVVLATGSEGKVVFVCKVTQDLVSKGFHAGNLVKEIARVAGGGGGGRPDFAQAGGKDASKIGEALALAAELITTKATA